MKLKFYVISFMLTISMTVIGGISAFAVDEEQDPELQFEQGVSLFEESNWPEALAKFSATIKLDPTNAGAYHYKGVCLLELKQYEEALKALEKAKSLKPDDRDVNMDIGYALQSLGKLPEAEAAFREELKNFPDNAGANFSLGYILFVQGKNDESIEYFAKAKQLDPAKSDSADFYMASAMYKSGKKDKAVPTFEALIAKGASPEITSASKSYLEAYKMEKGGTAKNWGISASLLYQFDDNVVAASDVTTFPLMVGNNEVSGQEDSRGVITLAGNYKIKGIDPWLVEGRYSFYQSFHAENDMFNLQYHLPSLTLGRTFKISQRELLATLDYRFGYGMLGNDYDMYSSNHWVGPNFRMAWNKYFITSLGYAYNVEDFKSNLPDRDNVANSIMGRADGILRGGKLSLSLYAGFDMEEADDENYDLQRTWGMFSVGADLPLKFKVKFSYRYDFEDYIHDDQMQRQDDIHSLEFMAFRPIWGPVEGTVGVSYKETDSSVESLSYDRTIFGGGIIIRY